MDIKLLAYRLKVYPSFARYEGISLPIRHHKCMLTRIDYISKGYVYYLNSRKKIQNCGSMSDLLAIQNLVCSFGKYDFRYFFLFSINKMITIFGPTGTRIQETIPYGSECSCKLSCDTNNESKYMSASQLYFNGTSCNSNAVYCLTSLVEMKFLCHCLFAH